MQTQYEWLKKIPMELARLDEIPLFGDAPPFPLELVQKHLAKTLNLNDLHIKPYAFEWRTQDNLFSGLGSNLMTVNAIFSRLEGNLFWVISEQNLKTLMSLTLLEGRELFEFLEQDYKVAFHRFLALEAIDAVNKAKWESELALQLQSEGKLPDEAMLSIDVSLGIGDQQVLTRIFLSTTLRKAIKEHYSRQTSNNFFSAPLSQKLELTVHLEAGSTTISLNEWAQVKHGDFLLLDHCSLIPGEEKGRVMLTISGRPYFRGKIKDGNIKILEHPLYYEVNEAMARNPSEDEELEDEEDLDEEFEDDTEEENDDELEEESLEEIEDEESEEEESDLSPEPAKIAAVGKAETKATPNDIPLVMVVEVGRLQMTVQKLLEMKPGNILELNVHPESGVDLVINGARVGKGELLQIGEVLGVRVLELG